MTTQRYIMIMVGIIILANTVAFVATNVLRPKARGISADSADVHVQTEGGMALPPVRPKFAMNTGGVDAIEDPAVTIPTAVLTRVNAKAVDVLVLGAGPTGLGVAWRMCEYTHPIEREHGMAHTGMPAVAVYDAAPGPGGMAATVVRDGFVWDFGGHELRSHYAYVDKMLAAIADPPGNGDHGNNNNNNHHGGATAVAPARVAGAPELVALPRLALGADGTWHPMAQHGALTAADVEYARHPLQHHIADLAVAVPGIAEDIVAELARTRGTTGAAHDVLTGMAAARNAHEWLEEAHGPTLARAHMMPYATKAWATPSTHLGTEWIAGADPAAMPHDCATTPDIRQVMRDMTIAAGECRRRMQRPAERAAATSADANAAVLLPPPLTAAAALPGALPDASAGRRAAFFYPASGGIGGIWDKVAAKIEQSIPGTLHYNANAVAVDLTRHVVTFEVLPDPAPAGTSSAVAAAESGAKVLQPLSHHSHRHRPPPPVPPRTFNVSYRALVSTLAPVELTRLLVDQEDELSDALGDALRNAVDVLRTATVHVVGVGVCGCPEPERVAQTAAHVHFPHDRDTQVRFSRLTIPSHYGAGMAPHGCYSLLAEIVESDELPLRRHGSAAATAHTKHGAAADARRPTEAELVAETVEQLTALGFVGPRCEVRSTYYANCTHAHPIPVVERDAVLSTLNQQLEKVGVFARGRLGGFKAEVGSMDHAFMQGVETGNRLSVRLHANWNEDMQLTQRGHELAEIVINDPAQANTWTWDETFPPTVFPITHPMKGRVGGGGDQVKPRSGEKN